MDGEYSHLRHWGDIGETKRTVPNVSSLPEYGIITGGLSKGQRQKRRNCRMNYIGSKYSLLIFLRETIEEVTGFKEGKRFIFADIFAGTGVVGQAFRAAGAFCIANDIQYYSYVLNKHHIENSPGKDKELLDHLNSLEPKEGFIYRNYCSGSGSGRNYFTDRNGMRCDAMRMELSRLKDSGEIDEGTYYYYLASLINSIDRYANTASVYGAFLKKIKNTAKRDFELELLPETEGIKGEVHNKDANELISEISGDVLYLDPPYNIRQYCSNYHVLETIARYDSPKLRGTTGLRDNKKQASRYCSRKKVRAAFEDLIKKADFKYVFLSYNNEGLMSLENIKNIMSGYGEYSYFTKEHKRFRADREENRRIASASTLEYLHCLKKP